MRTVLLSAGAVLMASFIIINGRAPEAAEIKPNETIAVATETISAARVPAPFSLTLNEISSMLSASRVVIPGHFWYTLTDAQYGAVLPQFSFPVKATVNYKGDGALVDVTAYAQTGAVALIVFAPGEVFNDYIFEYKPVVSEVNGVRVTAGVYKTTYIAKFKLGDVAYNIELTQSDGGGLEKLTEIVGAITAKGEPDLSVLANPVIPELLDEELTLEDARLDADFGLFIPKNIPARFYHETSRRFINQENNYLSIMWSRNYDYINWTVSEPAANDLELLVHADEREKYDMSLYTIPYAGSVPEAVRRFVDNPVFKVEEITQEMVRARAYYVNTDRGDAPGWRMNFGVLASDVLIDVRVKGASPEQVWEMVKEIIKNV